MASRVVAWTALCDRSSLQQVGRSAPWARVRGALAACLESAAIVPSITSIAVSCARSRFCFLTLSPPPLIASCRSLAEEPARDHARRRACSSRSVTTERRQRHHRRREE